MKVKTFADLMNGQVYAEIINLLGDNVVRKLSVAAGKVQIDALAPPIVSVNLTDKINFKPWVFDRGNLVFDCPEVPGGVGKICTEFDRIRYLDGTEVTIEHGDHADLKTPYQGTHETNQPAD